MSQLTVFSIGHSTHTYARFLELVRNADVTAIADVRTSPFSRHFPHFNKEALKNNLQIEDIVYSFLGKELGGRPAERKYYCDGIADYERMAQSPEFQHGLDRVIQGARKYRVALMCSEHDPLDCHRCLLVSRALVARGLAIKHIYSDGSVADHREIEQRLLKSEGHLGPDLFLSPEKRLVEAYRNRARKVAYAEKLDGSSSRAVTR